MQLFRKIWEWIRKIFASKAGKKAAIAVGGAGLAAGTAGGVEIYKAHKNNRRAERIKAKAIKRHDEERVKVEHTLAGLGETKLAIYKSFGGLADAVENIQQRPDYELSIDGIELPSFNPADFKQLSMEISAVAGSLGGVAVGGAVGVAAMGTGTILALAPGALVGGVVLCAMGAKMIRRSAENVKMAKQIEKQVDRILIYYRELDKTAKRFHKSFVEIQEPYFKYLRKMQKIVARKTDWEKYSKSERLIVKNAIMLAQMLSRMCSVPLVLQASDPNVLEKVNTSEVDRTIADANNVREQVRKGIAA